MPTKLNKPVLGIDQLSDETNLLTDKDRRITSMREGTNIDLDAEGNMSRRKGYTLKLAGSGYHSLYESTRGMLLVCNSNQMGIYNPEAATFTALTGMAAPYLTSFTELNGNIYFINPGHRGMIRSIETAVRPLGVALPDVSPIFTASTGSLEAGTYGVAFSIVNELGEESPLGPLVTLTLPANGGVAATFLTVVAGYTYRIYMTTTDGEELYQATEFAADTTSYAIGSHQVGRRPATQFLSRLPFGYTIRAFGSRLYIATDNFVYYSEPFLPHLANLANGFLPTTGFTTMLQPVDGGMFIGDQTGVYFYEGQDPADFKPKLVSDEVAVFGTAVAVPGSFLPEKYASADTAAVWLSASGYHIGLPSGEVVRLHARQVLLPRYVQGCAALSVQDGRKQLITPVNSNVLADASVALDSTIS